MRLRKKKQTKQAQVSFKSFCFRPKTQVRSCIAHQRAGDNFFHQAHWVCFDENVATFAFLDQKGLFSRRCFTFFPAIQAHVEGKIWPSTPLIQFSWTLITLSFKLWCVLQKLGEHFQAKLTLTGRNLVQDQSQIWGTVCLGDWLGRKEEKRNQIYPKDSSECPPSVRVRLSPRITWRYLPRPWRNLIWYAGLNVLKNTSATCRYEHQMWSRAPLSCNQMPEFAQIANFARDNLAFWWEFEELRPEGGKRSDLTQNGRFQPQGRSGWNMLTS